MPPMHWLQTLDTNLFLFCNRSLANPFFDWLMPILSGGNGFKQGFVWLAIAVGLSLLCFGNRRVRLCMVLMILVMATNDGLVCNPIKHAVARARPFVTLPEARHFGKVGEGYIAPLFDQNGVNLTASLGSHNSMPSSHASNWFAATMVLFLYFRKTLWFMLPLAMAVSFSRLYNGVHYPSDVLAGALIGAGGALAVAIILESAWQIIGKRWLPAWYAKVPSLVPDLKPANRKSC